jgi:PII-like signaling protein
MYKEVTMPKFFGEKILMRIFIGENDKFGRKPLYEALIDFLIEEGFAGATVLRGVAGFGAHSVYHTDRILRLSSDLPLIVEVVASKDKLDRAMPKIDEMMSGGLITMETVNVVRYCNKDDKQCVLNEP